MVNMDISLDISIASNYKSGSQIARVVTEQWATANLYCPACTSDQLTPLRPNTKVSDYLCQNCEARFQLKSGNKPFGRTVSNSAYHPKMDAIAEGRVPHYVFLHYSPQLWTVKNLFIVPGHFFTPAVIEERPPLRPGTRREGWVGSNILLGALPKEARIPIVSNEHVVPPAEVREAWTTFAFLGTTENAKGGWGADVLMCLRELQDMTGSNEFTLQDFYTVYEGRLASLHPENQNVKAKIRQQLQVLRDNNILEFEGVGRYHITK